MAALDAAAALPGAEECAPALAQRRVSFALYFGRPIDDVERALRAFLDLEKDMARRLHSSGAVYTTFPELRSYFEREVALVRDIPPCGIRDYVMGFVAGRL
ncbi:hypothetical protein [Haliangium sp.]|uniref:hypothetical protein n=1 Tax=Haliangium sp. TaxID=2663208 RepID=UPI003D0A9D0A